MKYLLFIYSILYVTSLLATTSSSPFPLFLKAGFSSVLEFEEIPTQIVLGDTQSFQVEKLNRSLVVKAVNPNTSSNMFVYFKDKTPQIFILTASDEAEPIYYKKFESTSKKDLTPQLSRKPVARKRSTTVLSTAFNDKKDSFVTEVLVSADSTASVAPNWKLVRLKFKGKEIKPKELWSERNVVQKDSQVKARFSFVKPDIPRNLKDVTLVIPLKDSRNPVTLKFVVRSR